MVSPMLLDVLLLLAFFPWVLFYFYPKGESTLSYPLQVKTKRSG